MGDKGIGDKGIGFELRLKNEAGLKARTHKAQPFTAGSGRKQKVARRRSMIPRCEKRV